MRTKYGALRAISTIYKLLAITVLVLSVAIVVLVLLFAFDSSSGSGSLGASVTWLVGGGILAVSLYATSEIFDLLIDMEENTRASRILLTRMTKLMANNSDSLEL